MGMGMVWDGMAGQAGQGARHGRHGRHGSHYQSSTEQWLGYSSEVVR